MNIKYFIITHAFNGMYNMLYALYTGKYACTRSIIKTTMVPAVSWLEILWILATTNKQKLHYIIQANSIKFNNTQRICWKYIYLLPGTLFYVQHTANVPHSFKVYAHMVFFASVRYYTFNKSFFLHTICMFNCTNYFQPYVY